MSLSFTTIGTPKEIYLVRTLIRLNYCIVNSGLLTRWGTELDKSNDAIDYD